jgi:hypothetical protein
MTSCIFDICPESDFKDGYITGARVLTNYL